MTKVKIHNKLPQVLPILLKNKSNPKELVHSQLKGRGSCFISPEEISPHLESLKRKGFITVQFLSSKSGPRTQTKLSSENATVKETKKLRTRKNKTSKKKGGK